VTEELWRNYNTRTRSWAVTSSSGFSAFPSRRSSSCIWACCIDNASCAMTYRLAEATRWLRTHPWLGYAVGLGIFAFGFLLRFAAGGLLDDVPFITLFPAILVAALLGGLHVGLTVAVLSGVGAWFFFVTPQNGWTWTGALTMVLFCVTAAIQLFVIDALNRAVDRLSDER